MENILGLRVTFIHYFLMALGVAAILFFLVRYLVNKTENGLALRNVVANTRRTIITLLAIGCAVAANIALGSYFLFMFFGLRETTIRSQTGHVQIMREGYFEEGSSSPTDYLILNHEEIEAAILADSAVAEKITFVTSEINFNGIVTGPTGEKSLGYLGKAVEPIEDQLFAVWDVYAEGEPLNEDVFAQVALGKGLAKQLGVTIDDYVTVLAVTQGGGFDVLDAQVGGILDTFAREYGNVLLKTNQEFGQEILATQGVNKLIVLLDDTVDTDFVYERVKTVVAEHPEWGVKVYGWFDITEFYHQVRSFISNIYIVVSTILFLLIIFLILNTVTMSVFERFSEFGTLRSIGLKRKNLVTLVLIEGVYLGFIGSVLGVVIAYVVGQALYGRGIQLPSPPGFTRPIELDLRLRFDYNYIFLVVSTALSCVGTALVSSWLPARRASKLQIVDSLRTNQ